MWRLPKSVRARLTIWYSVMVALPLVGFAVISYLIFSTSLIRRTDGFLDDALTVFQNELLVERRQLPAAEEAIRTTVREVRFRDLAIVVLDDGGQVVASSTAAPEMGSRGSGHTTPSLFGINEAMEEREQRGDEASWRATLSGPGSGYRVQVRPVVVGEGRFRIAGIYPLAEVEETLEGIRRLYVVMIPLLILLAGTGGWFLARRSFRPVSEMAERATEISATTLHERLPVASDDELGALARVFNDLLDRLQESFQQQKRFMADASHELRSPTAILRSETDVTLSREHRSEEEYRESLTVIKDGARRLTRVVDDLFLLARSDAGHPVMQPVPLYLDEVIRDTVRAVRPLAEGKGLDLSLSGTVEESLRGDPDLLGRLLLNLLDNAVEHSPRGGTVRVAMASSEEAVEVRVSDQGPGIPPDAKDRIFQRFFRVDPSRSRDGAGSTGGAGLGLAIARRIAEMHGGSLELAHSRPGSTEFILTLPTEGSTEGGTDPRSPAEPRLQERNPGDRTGPI